MATIVRPHHKTDTTAAALERTAVLVTMALIHVHRELLVLDGYPAATMSDGTPRGSAALTSVERVAAARVSLRMQRDAILDMIDAIASLAARLREVCTTTLGTRPRIDVPRCDGRTFEGAAVAWVPYSHDPHNGWHDPTCQDAADDSMLCPRCRLRERRWRDEHGLAQRAASVAAGIEPVAA